MKEDAHKREVNWSTQVAYGKTENSGKGLVTGRSISERFW
jgi:hypothetical protein